MMNLISYEGDPLPAMSRAEAREILRSVPIICSPAWEGGQILLSRDLALRICRGRAWAEMRGGRNGWERYAVDEDNVAHLLIGAVVAIWDELGLNLAI